MKTPKFAFALLIVTAFTSCNKTEEDKTTPSKTTDCVSAKKLDDSRGACDQTLKFTPNFNFKTNNNKRVITSNSIPAHKVGLFGRGSGSLNPNAIKEQSETYTIPLKPSVASQMTALLKATGSGRKGPQYSFGILLNGVELDPVAAEPFPHKGPMSSDVNWEYNLEALNVNLGLDCSNAHVQPTGKYHYHGSPKLYLESLKIPSNKMTLIGYAADGFPIYYKYAYTKASDSNSAVVEMKPSYKLKSGSRPGDGKTAPCGKYDGVYSSDYEYAKGQGTLDDANGRTGVTPEYPNGTYYYVITDGFPSIPRYFKGTPSQDFKIGR